MTKLDLTLFLFSLIEKRSNTAIANKFKACFSGEEHFSSIEGKSIFLGMEHYIDNENREAANENRRLLLRLSKELDDLFSFCDLPEDHLEEINDFRQSLCDFLSESTEANGFIM